MECYTIPLRVTSSLTILCICVFGMYQTHYQSIRFISLPIQDQANILHGIRGGWTMRSKIKNVVLLREAANQSMTMEKWIGYKEEGSLIPRGRQSRKEIEGSEL